MIKRPNNWNDVKEFTERKKLPVGAYVCRVKKAVIQNNSYGNQLCILFDIVDGEYSGFYAYDYKNNTREDKKWKGVLRLFLPLDDGSENDEWTKSTFKGMVTAFEKSNNGYTWNWDENSLVGKLVGILFRNEEWEFDGKTGWTARPFRAISVESVQDCDYQIPKDKPKKKKNDSGFDYSGGYSVPEYSASGFQQLQDEDAQLPF